MNTKATYQEHFDYSKMAQEALREQEVLRARLACRRAAGPSSPEQEEVWKRDNRMLYAMYLEQRANAKLFTSRQA